MTQPNPVRYAEDKLGVHEILEKTTKAHEELDKVYTVLSENRDMKRRTESDIEEREMEISIDERGKHADMSQAQMDKHIKMAFHKDEKLRELRERLAECIDALDGADFDRKIQERAIEIGIARMTELGGYFNYLAAVKNASATRA